MNDIEEINITYFDLLKGSILLDSFRLKFPDLNPKIDYSLGLDYSSELLNYPEILKRLYESGITNISKLEEYIDSDYICNICGDHEDVLSFIAILKDKFENDNSNKPLYGLDKSSKLCKYPKILQMLHEVGIEKLEDVLNDIETHFYIPQVVLHK